jgi:hypothetical protein
VRVTSAWTDRRDLPGQTANHGCTVNPCKFRGSDRLVLAAIAGRGRHGTFGFGPGLKHYSHFPGVHERAADVSIFRTGIESDQPVAVLAVGLEAVADSLRPLSKYLRAFRAFDSYFFVDHEMP